MAAGGKDRKRDKLFALLAAAMNERLGKWWIDNRDDLVRAIAPIWQDKARRRAGGWCNGACPMISIEPGGATAHRREARGHAQTDDPDTRRAVRRLAERLAFLERRSIADVAREAQYQYLAARAEKGGADERPAIVLGVRGLNEVNCRWVRYLSVEDHDKHSTLKLQAARRANQR